jgi:hypothetical protein
MLPRARIVSASHGLETSRYKGACRRKNCGNARAVELQVTMTRNLPQPPFCHVIHRSRRGSARFICLAVLASGLLGLPGSGNAATDETRSHRCSILQDQLNDELKEHAGSSRSANAANLGAKARKLCANGKPAQGLRTYVKALQLLGVQPIDPK